MKPHATLLILVGLGLAPGVVRAQWGPNGIPIPGLGGGNVKCVADGVGGIWAGVRSSRNHATNADDVYAQHLTSTGALAAGAIPTGIPVCTTASQQYFNYLASDGQGGALFGFFDPRNPGIGWTACVQRLGYAGSPPAGWPAVGIASSNTGNSGGGPLIAPDGTGGAFLIWTYLNGMDDDLYAQHVTAAGAISPGWPAAGLGIAAFPGNQDPIQILSDGAGGMTALWHDNRPGAPGVYMQRLLGDGNPAPGWPAGGYYLALDRVSQVYAADSLYFLHRLTSSGDDAPGWPANGTLVCTAPFVRNNAKLTADDAGNVFLSWEDYRNLSYSRVFAIELHSDRSLAPGWAVNGTPFSTYPGRQVNSDIMADGLGGVFMTWSYDGQYAFLQHFANGIPVSSFNADGIQLYPAGGQYDAQLAPDGTGGAIVVWENDAASAMYANRFPGPGPTATLLSLASAEVQIDRVSFLWQGDAAQSTSAMVERRSRDGDWQLLGSPSLDGSDRFRYEDHAVQPGEHWAYRLSYTLGGVNHTTAEAWVTVPTADRLALAGLRPNPSSGTNLKVAFSLADAGSTRLELLDVAGRRIATRELGALGAGTHLEPLPTDGRVPAGL